MVRASWTDSYAGYATGSGGTTPGRVYRSNASATSVGGRRILARQLLQDGHFERVSVEFHGALRDFLFRRAWKAQFAGCHRAAGLDGGAERPAGERPRFVKIAGPGRRVERRAGLVIIGRLAERPLRSVVRILAPQPRGCLAGAGANTRRARCVTPLQIRQSPAQTLRIQLADLKSAQAALVTARPALQPRPGLAGGFGQRRIDDLNQLAVVRHSLKDNGH